MVVEPHIETIELGEDSDTEESIGKQIEDIGDPESSSDIPVETEPSLQLETRQCDNTVAVNVKTEPVEEDGLSNVQVIAATHVTQLEIPDESPEQDSEVSCQTIEKRTGANTKHDDDDDITCTDILNLDDVSPNQPNGSEENVEKISSPDSEDDVVQIPSIVPEINIDLDLPRKEAPTEEIMPVISSVSSTVKIEKVTDVLVDDMLKVNTYNSIDDLIKDKVETFLNTPKENIHFEENKPDVSAINLKNKTLDLTAIDLMADLNFNDDGLEFIDDGVEFVEEVNEPKIGEDSCHNFMLSLAIIIYQ